MKKVLIIMGMAFAMAFAAEAYDLYSYTSTSSETIDGVTWQYCISNNEARIISSKTLRSSFVGSDLQQSYSYGYSPDYQVSLKDWIKRLKSSTPSSSTYQWDYSPAVSGGYSGYNSNVFIVSYYYSAIASSATGAIPVPSMLGGCPVVAVDAYAFGYCTGLTHVTIPEGVREIGPGAFYHCTGLVTVVIPSTVEKISTCAFDGCTSLAGATIPASVLVVGDYAFRNCSSMTGLNIKAGVEVIDEHAFEGCSSITRLVFPATVKKINQSAFSGCSKVSSMLLPEGVESIGAYAFNGCSSMTSASVPASVTNMPDHVFAGCGALKKAVINANITSFPRDTFWGCSSLQMIRLPDSITEIGTSCFRECHALSDIIIPDGVIAIGDHAFYNCRSLADIVIPSGLTRIEDNTFEGCSALTGIDLPDELQSIGSYAFNNCSSLTHADIPDTVTMINANAFVGCNGLERITVPGSVSTMASGAFNCPNATVIFTGDMPNYSVADSGLLNSKAISYPREYGANWQRVLGTAQFGGYTQTQEELPEVVIVSAQMRPTDSTILDVVYRVNSKDARVGVRVLAFEDGVRSFAKVVRPETFVDGTGANVGDNITANENHTISWRVSSDWSTDLAKMKFEVLAMRKNYIPLELITIPAIEGHDAMTITWNTVSPAQVINALYWLYADKDSNFQVVNGVLKNGSTTLMSGTTLSNPSAAITYIYSKMGYSVLDGANLEYARNATRLPLVVDASCPFAIKNN